MQVAEGIYRIESDLGPRFMCQYLLDGSDRKLLIDTGMADTPREVLAPYLARLDRSIDDIDDVVISHADVDHCGGNLLIRQLNPRVRLWCPEIDRPWVESNAAMMNENYGWHASYGFPQLEGAGRAAMIEGLGGDCPVDFGLRGGETIRLASDWRVEVMHLPGHTLGHIGIWDPRSRAAIVIDAVLERGIYDRAGNLLIPPRYYDVRAYRQTITRLISLRPDLLLTAHYPVMEGAAALDWLRAGLDFTHDVEAAVREGLASGIIDLWELTQLVDKQLGSYPDFMTELGAPVRAHLSFFSPPAGPSAGREEKNVGGPLRTVDRGATAERS